MEQHLPPNNLNTRKGGSLVRALLAQCKFRPSHARLSCRHPKAISSVQSECLGFEICRSLLLRPDVRIPCLGRRALRLFWFLGRFIPRAPLVDELRSTSALVSFCRLRALQSELHLAGQEINLDEHVRPSFSRCTPCHTSYMRRASYRRYMSQLFLLCTGTVFMLVRKFV